MNNKKIINELIELTKGCIKGKYDKKTGKERLNEIMKEMSEGES